MTEISADDELASLSEFTFLRENAKLRRAGEKVVWNCCYCEAVAYSSPGAEIERATSTSLNQHLAAAPLACSAYLKNRELLRIHFACADHPNP